MNKLKSDKSKLLLRIRAELCRMNLRCMIIGAVIVLLCGALSAFAAGEPAVYYELNKPIGAPPAIVFPVVWSVLYVLIGGAAGAVACAKERALESDKYKGLLFFILQMIFNFIWAPLFFGAGAYFAAFLAILMMILLSIPVLFSFWRIFKPAGFAIALYLAWLVFAAYLNLAVIFLN